MHGRGGGGQDARSLCALLCVIRLVWCGSTLSAGLARSLINPLVYTEMDRCPLRGFAAWEGSKNTSNNLSKHTFISDLSNFLSLYYSFPPFLLLCPLEHAELQIYIKVVGDLCILSASVSHGYLWSLRGWAAGIYAAGFSKNKWRYTPDYAVYGPALTLWTGFRRKTKEGWMICSTVEEIPASHLSLKGRYIFSDSMPRFWKPRVPLGPWQGKLLRNWHSVEWLCQICWETDLTATKSHSSIWMML